jgi:hypothetical membrane protein
MSAADPISVDSRRIVPSSRPRRALRLGAVVWIFAVQFFVLQALVQSSWTTPFSLRENFISDLGNTECGPYPAGSDSYVCSPWHAAMNASFIVQGLIIVTGGALLFRGFPPGRSRTLGFALLATAGPGLILVGVYPENVNLPPHKLGAGLQFVLGNLGIALLGIVLARAGRRPVLGAFSVLCGVVGVLATWLLVTDRFLGLGIGGMERFAAYPLPIWLIVMGIAFFGSRRLGHAPCSEEEA